MECFGLIAFVLVMCYSSYPTKVKKLESKIKRLERKLRGDGYMSKILNELINKKCILVTNSNAGDDAFITVNGRFECTILDVDDEWIKFTFTNKKGVVKTHIIRVESIDRVDFVED